MAFQWRHLAGASFLPCWVSWVCGKRFLSGSFPCRLCFPLAFLCLVSWFPFPPRLCLLPACVFSTSPLAFQACSYPVFQCRSFGCHSASPVASCVRCLLCSVSPVGSCVLFLCVLVPLLLLACCSSFTWPFWCGCSLHPAVPVSTWPLWCLCSVSLLLLACCAFFSWPFWCGCSIFTSLSLRALPSSPGLFGVLFCFHESLLACCSVFTWPFWRAVLFS